MHPLYRAASRSGSPVAALVLPADTASPGDAGTPGASAARLASWSPSPWRLGTIALEPLDVVAVAVVVGTDADAEVEFEVEGIAPAVATAPAAAGAVC
ncbi:hypothetical protein KDL01_38605, partial [Actinospica durhamensis]